MADSGRLVFFGTPAWAVPSLEALVASDWDIAAVVTNPDRPAGRGYELKQSEVKVAAQAADLEIVQPKSARDPEFRAWLEDTAPDVCVVVAYGKILPGDVLAVPAHGFVNLHFSLLPEYRGAAPVQRAVMDGRDVTGISVMVLTEGMDEGPLLAEHEVAVDPDETAGELGERLAVLGAPLLVDTVTSYVDGNITPVPQDDSLATYAAKLTDADARVVWSRSAQEIKNSIRGLNPVPGAWTTLREKRVKLHRVSVTDGDGAPGAVIDPARLVVATGDGALALEEVQPAGKKPMPGEQFARGLRPAPGELFE